MEATGSPVLERPYVPLAIVGVVLVWTTSIAGSGFSLLSLPFALWSTVPYAVLWIVGRRLQKSVARARRGHQRPGGRSGHPRVSLSLAARVDRGDRARLLSRVHHRARHADRSDRRLAVRADVAMARGGTAHCRDDWSDRARPADPRTGAAGALSNDSRQTTCVARTHWPATRGRSARRPSNPFRYRRKPPGFSSAISTLSPATSSPSSNTQARM